MVREISAGGVVVRRQRGSWWAAVIELPAPRSANPAKSPKAVKVASKPVLCLPKGLVDAGEKPLEAALREVREETGVSGELVAKLADSKYVYQRSWGDGERVFKIVSFYLLRYGGGRINSITPEMRVEVARARWIKLDEAPKALVYGGEKQIARRAIEYLQSHPELGKQ